MDIKERFYGKLNEARERLDEVSHALAKRAEHGAAEVYHRAYDQETDDRREAITKRTPEAKKKAEESGEKRKKAAKRVIRFQKYADKKKMNEEEQLDAKKKSDKKDKLFLRSRKMIAVSKLDRNRKRNKNNRQD